MDKQNVYMVQWIIWLLWNTVVYCLMLHQWAWLGITTSEKQQWINIISNACKIYQLQKNNYLSDYSSSHLHALCLSVTVLISHITFRQNLLFWILRIKSCLSRLTYVRGTDVISSLWLLRTA